MAAQIQTIDFYLNHCAKNEFQDTGVVVLSTSRKLIGEGLCKAAEEVDNWLIRSGLKKALLYYPGCQGRPYIFDGTFASFFSDKSKEETMNSVLEQLPPPEGFVWFGGVIVPAIRLVLEQMENSEEPTGLVEPEIGEDGILRTIQWGINRASVDLFGFNALSKEDMQSAIQRDTTSDWYPADLEAKRRLYNGEDSFFEQTARIKTKIGWMLVHFKCQRTGIKNLVLSRGRQESEIVERPELLVAV